MKNSKTINTRPATYYIYWLDENSFDSVKPGLASKEYKIGSAKMTPCETLNASGKKIIYAKPPLWRRVCTRQGSWYRESDKAGKTLLVSDHKLPGFMNQFLDAEMSGSDFSPESLPSQESLQQLVDSPAYQNTRPDEWEKPGIKDGLMFKILFSATRFWGIGDNLPRYWLNHRANHANFISKSFTTKVDGQDVPYTVSTNKGVCSSCVEFFNIASNDSRKLVRACPGSIIFSSVEKETYYDVRPINIPIIHIQ